MYYCYSTLIRYSQSFQLIVWLIPSFTAAAISVSIIGFLLGPMFPIAMNHTPRVLPRHLVHGTVGWISACSAGGNALLSFITGEMASTLGIESLQPLCVFEPQGLISKIHLLFFPIDFYR